MASNTKIEWCDHTVNLWWGCTKVHSGCDHCYAETLSKRWGNKVWGNDAKRKDIKSWRRDLLKYQRQAEKENTVKTVFVGSMMDIFERNMPLDTLYDMDTSLVRRILFFGIEYNNYDNLVFLFLTKRPSNINKMIPMAWLDIAPKNVWFGCSVSDQVTYDNAIKHMNTVKGNKFLSIEPQLGPIHLGKEVDIQWIIQGGESGHTRRYFDLQWAKSMNIQCSEREIPYFFKQIDKVTPIPDELLKREFPNF